MGGKLRMRMTNKNEQIWAKLGKIEQTWRTGQKMGIFRRKRGITEKKTGETRQKTAKTGKKRVNKTKPW